MRAGAGEIPRLPDLSTSVKLVGYDRSSEDFEARWPIGISMMGARLVAYPNTLTQVLVLHEALERR